MLGVFERIRYSEYIFWWALPVALTFNVFIGPWKVFRQSMLWIAGLGTFMEILTVLEEKIAAFWINVYLLLLIPTWLMVQLFGVPIEVGWILLQTFWWGTIQTWNVFVYELMGLYQAMGALFAVSIFIGYKNNEF